jgi:hypothetical protein
MAVRQPGRPRPGVVHGRRWWFWQRRVNTTFAAHAGIDARGAAVALLVTGGGRRSERHRADRDHEADQDRAKQAAALAATRRPTKEHLMAKLAFLGLGLMGTPMATRLLEAGHDITVWNRTSAKTRPLVDQGASAASSPAEAVAGADAAITMVATPQALEQVLFDDDGVLGALSPGQRLIDMSTVGPEMIRSVATRLPSHVTLIDAPVRGSVPEATAGRLLIYVGASQEAFDFAQPLLASLGTPHHVGGPGRVRLPRWSST